MKLRHHFPAALSLPLALLLGALLAPALGHATEPAGQHKETQSLGVSLHVVDPCLNSRNLQAPQCANHAPPQTTEKTEFFQIRNDRGMVVEDLPGRDFILRTIDFY